MERPPFIWNLYHYFVYIPQKTTCPALIPFTTTYLCRRCINFMLWNISDLLIRFPGIKQFFFPFTKHEIKLNSKIHLQFFRSDLRLSCFCHELLLLLKIILISFFVFTMERFSISQINNRTKCPRLHGSFWFVMYFSKTCANIFRHIMWQGNQRHIASRQSV